MSAMAKSRLRLLALMLVFAVLLGSAQSLIVFADKIEHKSESEASIEFRSGPLVITQAPEIVFGRYDVNNRTTRFLAESTSNPILITDATGKHAGWTLKAKLSNFYNENERPGLSGASLIISSREPKPIDTVANKPTTLKDKVEVVSGSSGATVIMGAKVKEGAGNWQIDYTNKDFTLFVPHASKDAGKYKAVMEWTLIDDPTS